MMVILILVGATFWSPDHSRIRGFSCNNTFLASAILDFFALFLAVSTCLPKKHEKYLRNTLKVLFDVIGFTTLARKHV